MSEADTQAVLFANDAFYLAFKSADYDTMETVWAKNAPLSCIHPGWPPLVGREQVLESWRGILANQQQQAAEPAVVSVQFLGEVAVVLCYEMVGRFALIATNVFARERGAWRMVHHQSGETPPPPPEMRSSRATRIQ